VVTARVAAVFFEAAEDDPDELPGVLAVVAPSERQLHAQRHGQTFEVFDPGFVKAVSVELHARSAS
jgi:hypothetical protein